MELAGLIRGETHPLGAAGKMRREQPKIDGREHVGVPRQAREGTRVFPLSRLGRRNDPATGSNFNNK